MNYFDFKGISEETILMNYLDFKDFKSMLIEHGFVV